jgi:hypothetical protein
LFGAIMTSHSLLRAVAVCARKSVFTQSIVSPTRVEISAGVKVSLSTLTRVVSAAACVANNTSSAAADE